MATEMIHSIASAGDYTTCATWETALQSDLTAATSKVFSHSGITGVINPGDTVTGSNSTATGTVTGIVTSTQIYLTGIGGTFQSAENFEKDGSNYVTSTDAGDSPIIVGELDGATPFNPGILLVSGWTANITNYVILRVKEGSEHLGVPGGSGCEITSISGTDLWGSVYALVPFTQIIGVEVDIATNTTTTRPCFSSGAATVKFTECIAKPSNVANSWGFTNYGDSDLYPAYENCIVFGQASVIGFVAIGSNPWSAINCAAVECNIGFYDNTSAAAPHSKAINCVSMACSYPFYSANGWHASTSYNAADDTSAPGTDTVDNITSTDFVDSASDNYIPSPRGALADTGAELSGIFTNDIQGIIRVLPWDIGPYVALPNISPAGVQSLNNQFMPIAALRINGVIQ